MTIPFDFLLPLLCCPQCRSSLKILAEPAEVLVCQNSACRLQYAIQDEIPVLNPEFGQQVSLEQWQVLCAENLHS